MTKLIKGNINENNQFLRSFSIHINIKLEITFSYSTLLFCKFKISFHPVSPFNTENNI